MGDAKVERDYLNDGTEVEWGRPEMVRQFALEQRVRLARAEEERDELRSAWSRMVNEAEGRRTELVVTERRVKQLEEARTEFLCAVDESPPEIMNEPDNSWRIGGAATRAWLEAIRGLRALARGNRE